MKQKLTHNLNLKVLAVLFSIIIWIVVVNIDDPIKSVQFNDVTIDVLNKQLLTEKNLVADIVAGQETVDVTVSGRRSVIEDLSKDNISVSVDCKDLNDSNTLALKVSSNKYSGDIDSMKPEFDKVELNVEELKKIQKAIQVEPVGFPADGYILGDYTISLNRVNIEGPKSVIDKVQSAKVQVDVDGASGNISASAPIILYDALGERLDSSKLKMNLDNINVSQEVLYTKTIDVVCNVSGEPEEGYKSTGNITVVPSKVTIAGMKTVLDNISQVTVPASAVNISNQNSTFKTSVNIFNYLPSGVESAEDSFKGTVNVSVEIEKETEKTFNIYFNKISFDGLPEGLSAEIINGTESAADNRVEITAYGLAEDIGDVVASDIKVEADFDKYMEETNVTQINQGYMTVPLKVTLPEGLRMSDTLKIRIRVKADET
ncbi:MAG: hypothetical protein J6X80_03680 [Lachnospiraceae bacterium]|nr:hypothetical protein [Lachnospiraceae bacterium]